METIKAKLYLYPDVRETPFHNGYRPTFDFGTESFTSGRIRLLDEKKSFFPGEKDEVEIDFLSNNFFGERFKVGEKIIFTEGLTPVGEIEILKIMFDE